MQVGDLVSLDTGRGKKLTGIILEINKNHKVGIHAFPCLVAFGGGQWSWMREDFLEVVNAAG